MTSVLVTGANGTVGSAFTEHALRVCAALRTAHHNADVADVVLTNTAGALRLTIASRPVGHW